MARIPRLQPLPIRLAHWANVLLLTVMAGTGLEILVAFPYFGPRGEVWPYPLQGQAPPTVLRMGGWLAGARHWHFGFAWLFVLNGAVYLAYLLASGEWRRRLFVPKRDFGDAIATARHYLRLGPPPPVRGLYNGLQRLAYTSVLVMAPLQIATGLALYKPVQLAGLSRLFGGYDAARVIHFVVLFGLALFTAVHVVQVAAHVKTLPPMVTGGARRETEEQS